MFIGAKCFCGVETYRHKAPIAVSAGLIIGYILLLGALGLFFDQTMKFLGRRFFRYEAAGR